MSIVPTGEIKQFLTRLRLRISNLFQKNSTINNNLRRSISSEPASMSAPEPEMENLESLGLPRDFFKQVRNKISSGDEVPSEWIKHVTTISMLRSGKVSHIPGLSNLSKLAKVDISKTGINNLPSLQKLDKILEFNLSDTSISDLSELSHIS